LFGVARVLAAQAQDAKDYKTPISGGASISIIGEGGYGCITSPALSCKGRADTEFEGLVSKTLDNDEATKELQEMQRLSRIDTLVSPPETANTLQARFRFGVYARAWYDVSSRKCLPIVLRVFFQPFLHPYLMTLPHQMTIPFQTTRPYQMALPH
jgi:hypothetical protein